MGVQVARTHSYARFSLSLSTKSSRLLTQFFASLCSFLSSFFILLYVRDSWAHDFASTSSVSSSSSSSTTSAAAALPSSPSAPSRDYIQARCIPEPREWKDLVKVSRSLAYAWSRSGGMRVPQWRSARGLHDDAREWCRRCTCPIPSFFSPSVPSKCIAPVVPRRIESCVLYIGTSKREYFSISVSKLNSKSEIFRIIWNDYIEKNCNNK